MATTRIQLRRGTEAQWTAANPTLAAGEIGIETDTNTFKFGDGTTAWSSLDYALADTVDDYIPLSQKGVASGVATLDGSGKVPYNQIPSIDELSQDAVNTALVAGSGITKVYNDGANTITVSVDTSVIATKAELAEVSQDSINDALVAGTGLDKTYDDVNNLITIDIDSTVVTLAGTQTLTNKTITSPAGLVKADVGLENVDNTSDANKPISTATQAALDSLSTSIESAVAGISIKDSVRAASDTNITLTGTQTIDGVTLSAGDRVLVAGQTDARTNGVWTCQSGSWTRATDFDQTSEVKEGSFVFVQEGTHNGSHGFVLISEGSGSGESIIFGTDSLNFTQFTGANLVIAGTGLVKTGDNTLNVNTSEIATIAYVGTAIDGLDADFATKANLDGGATFTGTIVLPSTTSIADVSSQEISYLNGVTSSIQTQITNLTNNTNTDVSNLNSLKAPLASPTFTGTVVLPATTSIDNVSGTEISYLNGATSNIQQQINELATSANAVFTGEISLPQTTSIGEVSSTEIQHLNGVSAAIQGQIDTKSPSANPTFTGTVVLPNTTSIGEVSSVEIGYLNGVTTSIQSQIDTKATVSSVTELTSTVNLKAPLASPTFTGTVNGITATMVGLSNVDNTSDANKPISTATQTALDLKSNIASPTFTGTPAAPTATVGTDTTQIATTAFVQDAIEAVVGAAPAALNTLSELANALNDDASFSSTVTNSLALKAPLASPTFTGTVTVAESGVAFTDGTQTKAGVPSLTTIGTEISAAYNLSTGGLGLRDQLIPIAGARAITIPANSTTAYPVGTSIDWYQASGTGANFVAAAGVTILRTPGLTLRTTHSSATLTKVATDTWLLAGDLTA